MALPKCLGYREPLLVVGEACPLAMVRIPGGRFMMGSPVDEPQRRNSEGPPHRVAVSSFLLGRYPVTQTQWRVVADWPPVQRSLNPDLAYFKGADRPVEQVSWFEAVEFCDRLAQYTKRPYRLPSEAEWEYACRAGTRTPFHEGDHLTTAVANYDGRFTYAAGPEGAYRGATTPVMHFGVGNAFGLCDLHGNVAEWCEDPWHETYNGAPRDGRAWVSASQNTYRVTRGGAWGSPPSLCRSASRYRHRPDARSNSIGFRVACSAPRTWESLKSGGYPP